VRAFLSITKALSDETRVRALLSLREGELCLCQIIDLLELAPSTVSKHMALLHQAGLVERRKEGRWHYFRLAGKEAPAAARQAVRWTLDSLQQEPQALGDSKKLCCTRRKDLSELSSCYSR
jgi:ArsR family transcriptional regulator, arsenate/arsenite/antimonite-responsive transcriptional repressor